MFKFYVRPLFSSEAKLKDGAGSGVDGGSPGAEPTASAPC